MTKEAKRETENSPSLLKEILFLLGKIVSICIVFLLLFTFMFGINRTTDRSMAPAIKDGDLAIFYRLDKNYVAQDTIIIEYRGEKQVRRVIATAGDTVDITEDGLKINNALQQEMNIYTATQRYDNEISFPLTIGEGQIFVLADNRVNAEDSRIYGAVEINDTMGKVMAIIRRRGI